MQVIPTEIPDVKEIRPVRHHDARGFFSEIFRESVLRENGITVTFVQENHSLSMDRFVVRGLHFQIPPASKPSSCASSLDRFSMSRSTFAPARRHTAHTLLSS